MANEVVAVGLRIRQFIRQVFGSRLVSHMEEEMMQMRNDYELRLRDKDLYVADLKEEITRLKGKVAEYELVLIPITSGGLFGPKRTPPTMESVIEPNSWQSAQKRFYDEQEAELAKEQ